MIRIGIDVGGTGIQFGAVDSSNRIIHEESIPTRTDIPFEEQVKRIAECVKSTAAGAGLSVDDIESVGIGIPGIASASTGRSSNAQTWDGITFPSAQYSVSSLTSRCLLKMTPMWRRLPRALPASVRVPPPAFSSRLEQVSAAVSS